MEEQDFTAWISIRCRCGGVLYVGTSAGAPAVAHSMPICAGFDQLDMATLMREDGALSRAVAALARLGS